MRSPFHPVYRANFCAECGNHIESHGSGQYFNFWPRYFCPDCAKRLKQHRLITPLTGLLLIASLVIFAFSYKPANNASHQGNYNLQSVPVSAQDSIVNAASMRRAENVENKERVICGAKTKRGTPCRHVVQYGQRCKQHQGLSSMLDEANKPK